MLLVFIYTFWIIRVPLNDEHKRRRPGGIGTEISQGG